MGLFTALKRTKKSHRLHEGGGEKFISERKSFYSTLRGYAVDNDLSATCRPTSVEALNVDNSRQTAQARARFLPLRSTVSRT